MYSSTADKAPLGLGLMIYLIPNNQTHREKRKGGMVKICESWIPPSPNLDKVTVCFDKLNNTDERYIEQT